MDIFSIAAGVGVLWFLKLAASKGLPAAVAWVKTRWNAGKADFSALQGDVGDLTSKLTTLEQGAG
jgi:hypothetical protein